MNHFKSDGTKVQFMVESYEDASITLELEPDTEYKVKVGGVSVGKVKTNLGGKLNVSVELNDGESAAIDVEKC